MFAQTCDPRSNSQLPNFIIKPRYIYVTRVVVQLVRYHMLTIRIYISNSKCFVTKRQANLLYQN